MTTNTILTTTTTVSSTGLGSTLLPSTSASASAQSAHQSTHPAHPHTQHKQKRITINPRLFQQSAIRTLSTLAHDTQKTEGQARRDAHTQRVLQKEREQNNELQKLIERERKENAEKVVEARRKKRSENVKRRFESSKQHAEIISRYLVTTGNCPILYLPAKLRNSDTEALAARKIVLMEPFLNPAQDDEKDASSAKIKIEEDELDHMDEDNVDDNSDDVMMEAGLEPKMKSEGDDQKASSQHAHGTSSPNKSNGERGGSAEKQTAEQDKARVPIKEDEENAPGIANVDVESNHITDMDVDQ